jgi:hypothetical protein
MTRMKQSLLLAPLPIYPRLGHLILSVDEFESMDGIASAFGASAIARGPACGLKICIGPAAK